MAGLNWARDVAKFTPRQLQAWETFRSTWQTCYGGAMGGGKSYFLRWALLGHLWHLWNEHGIRGRAMLACESYTTLHDRQITRIATEIPSWIARWKPAARELVLAPELGGGVLCLRNLDDPGKYMSSEWCAIGVDEATRNPPGMRVMLATRLRWPGLPAENCRMVFGTNPGGPSHAEFHRIFVLGRYHEGEHPEDYAYVPALATDNPHIDDGYMRTLDALPEKLRAAYKGGSWDVFEGQVFSEFDPALHVIRPFTIPAGWVRHGALDYGYSPGYSAALWVATDTVRGLSYCYREVYVQEQTPEQLARTLLDADAAECRGWAADPSLWARNPQTGRTSAEVLQEAGLPVFKANNDRLDGWRRMHEYLAVQPRWWPPYLPGHEATEEVDQPGLRFFECCEHAIRTIPTLSYDDRPAAVAGNVEDARKGGEDHLADACRYWCASDYPRLLAPAGPRVEDAPGWLQ